MFVVNFCFSVDGIFSVGAFVRFNFRKLFSCTERHEFALESMLLLLSISICSLFGRRLCCCVLFFSVVSLSCVVCECVLLFILV